MGGCTRVGARVYRSTSTLYAKNLTHTLVFEGIRFQYNLAGAVPFWSVGDPTKLFIPMDGLYEICANFCGAYNDTPAYGIEVGISLNGSTIAYRSIHKRVVGATGLWLRGYVVSAMELSRGQYLTMTIYPLAASCTTQTDGYVQDLSAVLVGRSL